MLDFDKYVSSIKDSAQLDLVITESKNDTTKCCDLDEATKLHLNCFSSVQQQPAIPQCQDALTGTIIKVISVKPNLIDDCTKRSVADYFKSKGIKAKGLISPQILSTLFQTNSQLITWLKYESLLTYLIKEQVYEPKQMANEVLATVKTDLKPEIAAKFSSAISACVKYCRESNKLSKIDDDEEEEEEKWCEIIEWMSWFLVTEDGDFV